MKKLIAVISLVLVSAFVLAGCASAPATMEEPAQAGKDYWKIEYVEIDESLTIPCLWNKRGSTTAVMSCDWDSNYTLDSLPEGTPTAQAGKDYWKIEYVEVNGETIRCLWNKRGSTTAVMSCDF